MVSNRIVAFGLAVGLSACGSRGSSGSGGGGAGGATSTSSTSSTSSTGAPTGCPPDAPYADPSCSPPDLHCTYGDSRDPYCRLGYACHSGTWQIDGVGCDTEDARSVSEPSGGHGVSGADAQVFPRRGRILLVRPLRRLRLSPATVELGLREPARRRMSRPPPERRDSLHHAVARVPLWSRLPERGDREVYERHLEVGSAGRLSLKGHLRVGSPQGIPARNVLRK